MLIAGHYLQTFILNQFQYDLKSHLEVIVIGIVFVTTAPVILKMVFGKTQVYLHLAQDLLQVDGMHMVHYYHTADLTVPLVQTSDSNHSPTPHQLASNLSTLLICHNYASNRKTKSTF
jgi:CRISPR/Cas system endoribonuclease Cas6 (RAMP superfamily)